MNQTFVIAGAGHAGGRAALTLREAGFDGRVVLIGDEPHGPYERPPLSKQALLGDYALGTCALASAAGYAERGIEHLAGVRVDSVDAAAREVVIGARRIAYDRLLLATGGTPRHLPGVPATATNVHYLRTWDDALHLRAALLPGQRLVVVGGGFIGLEVAATARRLGCSVEVLEAGERLAARALPASFSEALGQLHAREGVRVHLGARIAAVEGQARVTALRLESGEVLACDALLVGIGIEPELSLARSAGLAVGNGICVDATLRSSDPAIYVAGDACEFACPQSGLRQRQETWRNAEAQGRLAALNMLGGETPFAGLAGFWSDQFDWTLQRIGHWSPEVRTVVRLPDAEGARLEFYLDPHDRLLGACGFARGNASARDLKLAERLIDSGQSLDTDELADPAIPLKRLLRTAHA